jgi:predicted RNA-binding protein YlqC (UPF0109 family)
MITKEELETQIIDFVQMLVGSCVFNPDELRVTFKRGYMGYAVSVFPNEVDYGKVYGGAGINLRAFSAIVKQFGYIMGFRGKNKLMLILDEIPIKRQSLSTRPVLRQNWEKEEIIPIVVQILKGCGKDYLQFQIIRRDKTSSAFNFSGSQHEWDDALIDAISRIVMVIGINQGHILKRDPMLHDSSSVHQS